MDYRYISVVLTLFSLFYVKVKEPFFKAVTFIFTPTAILLAALYILIRNVNNLNIQNFNSVFFTGGIYMNLKLILRSVCCAVILCIIFSTAGFCGACNDIEDRLLRFHIIANSDSKEDQTLKLKVRDRITNYTDTLFAQCHSKNEAIHITKKNLSSIESLAQKLVVEEGFDYNVNASLTKMHFNTRVYDDFTLPAGTYDAVRIVIGNGEGHNWWCVLYPSVCVSAAKKDIGSALSEGETDIVKNSDRYIIKFKLIEWFEELFR